MLVLLLRLNYSELRSFPPNVWRRWAPIILAVPTAFGEGRWDDKATLLELASEPAADDLFTTAVRLV